MTQDELDAILKRNPALSVGDTGTPAVVERSARHEPLAKNEVQEGTTSRLFVRITSYRKRLADPDGLCEKYFLDCCRYAGWLADDSAEHISLETRQEKASGAQGEETVIEIYTL